LKEKVSTTCPMAASSPSPTFTRALRGKGVVREATWTSRSVVRPITRASMRSLLSSERPLLAERPQPGVVEPRPQPGLQQPLGLLGADPHVVVDEIQPQ